MFFSNTRVGQCGAKEAMKYDKLYIFSDMKGRNTKYNLCKLLVHVNRMASHAIIL